MQPIIQLRPKKAFDVSKDYESPQHKFTNSPSRSRDRFSPACLGPQSRVSAPAAMQTPTTHFPLAGLPKELLRRLPLDAPQTARLACVARCFESLRQEAQTRRKTTAVLETQGMRQYRAVQELAADEASDTFPLLMQVAQRESISAYTSRLALRFLRIRKDSFDAAQSAEFADLLNAIVAADTRPKVVDAALEAVQSRKDRSFVATRLAVLRDANHPARATAEIRALEALASDDPLSPEAAWDALRSYLAQEAKSMTLPAYEIVSPSEVVDMAIAVWRAIDRTPFHDPCCSEEKRAIMRRSFRWNLCEYADILTGAYAADAATISAAQQQIATVVSNVL